jgi:hypothetical protein
MDNVLTIIQAIVRHDDKILPIEILDQICALTMEDIPPHVLLYSKYENQETFLTSYQDDVKFEIQQYYKTMFCQHLPLDDWIKIIRTRVFTDDLYIAPLLKIFNDSTISICQREREMNEMLHSLSGVIYDRYNILYQKLTFKEWTTFIDYVHTFRSHDIFRLLHLVRTKSEVKLFELKHIQHDFRFFSFIGRWKNVEVDSIHLPQYYFDTGSHYEGTTFYCKNSSVHEITYVELDGTRLPGKEDLFMEHSTIAQTTNWKDYILHVPLSHFHTLYLYEFNHILQGFLYDIPLPKHRGTLGEYLKVVHNLIGRIHPDFPCSVYHKSLSRHRNQLNTKELFFASENILFPELNSQDTSFTELFRKQWNESFEFFTNLFLYHIEKHFLPVSKPSMETCAGTMKESNVEILSLIHSKNQRYFNMDPPSLWTDDADEHYQMEFCRNALDTLFFDLKIQEKYENANNSQERTSMDRTRRHGLAT